jgi:hypothetical protein
VEAGAGGGMTGSNISAKILGLLEALVQ